MLVNAAITFAAFAISANALQVTAPTNSSGWTTQGAQEIKWDSVSTDPSSFTIQLITPSSPNSPITVAEDVQTSAGSYVYTPSEALGAADQYRVNFISTTQNNAGILAQSNYFEVEAGESSASASASASGSAVSAKANSSAGASRSGSPSGAAASVSSAAASATQSGAASALIAPTGMLALFAAALGLLA